MANGEDSVHPSFLSEGSFEVEENEKERRRRETERRDLILGSVPSCWTGLDFIHRCTCSLQTSFQTRLERIGRECKQIKIQIKMSNCCALLGPKETLVLVERIFEYSSLKVIKINALQFLLISF